MKKMSGLENLKDKKPSKWHRLLQICDYWKKESNKMKNKTKNMKDSFQV